VRFDTLSDLFTFLLTQTGQRSESSQGRSIPLTHTP
jgi:hypothetical protein